MGFRLKASLKEFLIYLNTPMKMKNILENEPLIDQSKVQKTTKYAFALGHIFNDLAAAMWFSYTLLFLQRVALLQPLVAGSLMLLGQVTDAISTPIIGMLVDKYSSKKVWHVYGSIMVAVSFPIIFGSYINPRLSAMIVYIIGTVIFQIGWAAVQISHLSMIPILSSTPLGRAELTATRYSAQVIAAVVAFSVTWMILPNRADFSARVGPQDDYKFRRISLALTIIGVISSTLFHEFLNARLLDNNPPDSSPTIEVAGQQEAQRVPPRRREQVPRSSEVGRPAGTVLLAVSFLYASARLFTALTSVYMPLFIVEVNVGGKQALASVPLVCFLSSFATSLLLRHLMRPYGSKACYLLGTFVGLLSAIIIEFIDSSIVMIYLIAISIGASCSILTVAALNITADLIGPRTESSAFVYSIVTFIDKIIMGIAVFLIEKWRCNNRFLCPHYNQNTLSLVSIFSMSIGLVTLLAVSRYLPSNN